VSTSHYASLFQKRKLYIIDECHALSKQAWQAFLKTIEEPPDHVYFVFCTTEESKVPKTVKTRCHSYTLKSVNTKELEDYLFTVADSEKVGPVNDDAITLIARQSYGSVRQGLVFMSMCDGLEKLADVEDMLATPGTTTDVRTLCQALLKRDSLETVLMYVKDLEDAGFEAENCRIVIQMYMKAVFLNSKGKKLDSLAVMDCFSRRCDGPDGMALFCLCVADLYLGGK
jgi:DNA polymerase-3 subunit gamma/tau